MEAPKFYTREQAQSEASHLTKELNKTYPSQEGRFAHGQYIEVDENIEKKHIEFIEEITSGDASGFLAGGYASDLLIHENFVTPHTDVDVIAKREDEIAIEETVKNLGYKIKSMELGSGKSGVEKKFISQGSMKADLAIVDIDESGDPFFRTVIKGETVRVYFDSGTFSSEPVLVNGKRIKTISPLAQVQSLIFYSQLGLDEMREKDASRISALISKYFPNETLESDIFKIRVEKD